MGGDRADRAPEIGLFRHALIRPVADPQTKIQPAPARAEALGQHTYLDPFVLWAVVEPGAP